MALLDRPGSIFGLPKLDLDHQDASKLAPLPDITPGFALPRMDEYDAAEERLLGSLNGRSWYALMRAGGGDIEGKGKEKEVDERAAFPEYLQAGAADEPQRYDDVYERAGESSSPKRTFAALRSWDVLDPDFEAQARAKLLSEGGTKTFEALLASQDAMPLLPGLPEKTLPATVDLEDLVKIMLRSTLGTSTSGSLRWVAKEGMFKWDMNHSRPEGLDKVLAASAMQDFLFVASGLRRLEIIVDSQSSELLTPTHHALFHAVSTYLTYIKQHLAETIKSQEDSGGSSWNSSSFALSQIRDLLKSLCEVLCWPLGDPKPTGLPSRASSLLTHLYSHLLALHSTSPSSDSPQILCLAYLLSISSAPVLTLLHQWVGLQDSHSIDTDPSETSQPWSDLGIHRKVAKSSGAYLETGQQAKWEYEFTSKRMPAFIPRELRRTLFEAGRSLRLLREASDGQHPLCAGKWTLEASWGWGGKRNSRLSSDMRRHTRLVQSALEHWRRSVRDRTRPLSGSSSQPVLRARKERKPLPLEFMPKTTSPEQYTTPVIPDAHVLSNDTVASEEDEFWALFDKTPGSHLDTAQNGQLWRSSPLDELQAFLAFHTELENPLLPLDSPTFSLFTKSHLLSPLLLHAELVSTALVSLYLDDLHVLDHLDILRAYWLGGDAGFTERVSRALFGKDEAGAGEALGMGKRARTRARLGLGGGGDGMLKNENAEWGIGLGLGLSERAKWPPGGAELAYALRTTLLDDLHQEKGEAWEGIEDKVSFAIKPLMEDGKDGRRAKWLNPQAIEALDFLYLAYSPPPSVTVLFPKGLLEKYQRIHNIILRLSRVHVVLNSLFYDVLHPTNPDAEDLKVGVDARTRRPASRGGVVEKESRGVLSIDKPLFAQTQMLRYRMTNFVDSLSRYVLDRAIGIHWDKMRTRLEKLKRKKVIGTDTSRPGTPVQETAEWWDVEASPEEVATTVGDDDEEQVRAEEWEDEVLNINQLHSIHSIVTYHHLTLDRILRACLLSDHPGQQVVFKVLMTLFGLILDVGKVIKELEKRWADLDTTRRKVERIQMEWNEKEAIFMYALERLSLRHQKRQSPEEGEERAHQQDLDLLLQDGDDDGGARATSGGNEDLQELLLRLSLRVAPVPRRGKHAPSGPEDS